MRREPGQRDMVLGGGPGDQKAGEGRGSLRTGGFTVHLADTVAHARRIVNEIIPRDKAVFTSTNETTAGIRVDRFEWS